MNGLDWDFVKNDKNDKPQTTQGATMTLSKADHELIRKIIHREPTLVEETIFDTMWSEHCSYKSTKPVLKTLPTKGSEVMLGVGEDSGIVKLCDHDGHAYGVVISHESHNHPSQILPVEGAATGVGGVVRDVYCMGADVIGALNSLHFGIDKKGNNPLIDEIADGVIQGISEYGNPLGVPVLGGETLYHESYNDNCLVNVAGIGLVREDHIIHSYTPKEAKTIPYDVVLIGKSTDATGFGGASFSSATLDKEDEQSNLGAVQVHDPFLKRVIAEALKVAFDEIFENKVPVGFKDLGAGGISCATSEIASSGGFGVTVDLDKVNVALPDLPAHVITCSETQERFCMTVPQTFTKRLLEIFNKDFELPKLYPNAGAVVIGTVTASTDYVVVSKGQEVCRLPIEAITTEVRAERKSEFRQINRDPQSTAHAKHDVLEPILKKALAHVNACSKRYVYRFFDQTVQGRTVIHPGEGDAVVLAPLKDSPVGLAVTMDSNLYGAFDPYVSGAAAVAEGIRNIISVGARPLAVTDCLNYGNPEKPPVFFDFEEGVRGIGEACRALSFIPGEPVPVISGNVSLYNESKQGNAVVPSPVICVLGKLDRYENAKSMVVKSADQQLILVGRRYSEFGGTQVSDSIAGLNACAPQVRLNEEIHANKAVYEAHSLLTACHDISSGGAWSTICEMLLGERGLYKVGAQLTLPKEASPLEWFFSENGGYILAVTAENFPKVEAILKSHNVWHYHLGVTIADSKITIRHESFPYTEIAMTDVESAWNSKNAA